MPRRGDPLNRIQDPRGPLDLFTDRKTECQAFTEALTTHRSIMDAADESEAARNVLVFYGTGGLGKSELSRRLERWVTEELPHDDHWGPPPASAVAGTARIDLHMSTGKLDFVEMVVAIRQAFGAVKKRWPAFDVGFHAYWSATHPGEELPGMGTKYQNAAEGISETVVDVLADLDVPGTPVKLGVRGVRKIASAIQKKKLRRAAFNTSDGYPDFLRRLVDEPAKEDPKPELVVALSTFLDYELSLLDKPERLIVVFIDAFERLSADPRRTDEILLNRLIYGMPNVLFVITGRNKLDWCDERAMRLPHHGPLRWPTLVLGAADEPRQHLVGKLDSIDRMTFIDLSCQYHGVELDRDISVEIARASGGLPQYLQIACSVAANIVKNDRGPVSIDRVTGSLDELVERVLEDVPADEQRALRAAAALPYFDAEIVAAAAQVDVGCALRAMGRPIIDERRGELFPYSMHDEIRAALRHAGHTVPGGWSAEDWRRAATHALRRLRIQYDARMSARQIRAAVQTLGLAITLVCDNDATVDMVEDEPAYDDWLTLALVRGPSTRALYQLVPPIAATAYGQGLLDFILAKSDVTTVDEKCQLLTNLFESDHALSHHAGRHRGYVLRNAYEWDAAIASFDELIAQAPSQVHLFQRVLTLVAARRFREALDAASVLAESRQIKIRASCRRASGHFEADWFATKQISVDAMVVNGRHREALEEQGMLYRWRALIVGDLTLDSIEDFRELAEITGHRAAIRDALVAHAFTNPTDFTRESDRLLELETIDRGRNGGNLGFRSGMTIAALAWLKSDGDRLALLRNEIDLTIGARGRLWIGAECLLDHLGFAVRPVHTQWIEPQQNVINRWAGHFSAWRMRVSTAA